MIILILDLHIRLNKVLCYYKNIFTFTNHLGLQVHKQGNHLMPIQLKQNVHLKMMQFELINMMEENDNDIIQSFLNVQNNNQIQSIHQMNRQYLIMSKYLQQILKKSLLHLMQLLQLMLNILHYRYHYLILKQDKLVYYKWLEFILLH